MTPLLGHVSRRLRRVAIPVAAILAAAVASGAAAAQSEPDELLAEIRSGIENRDYGVFEELVFWKDAGEIKRRVVRFEINRTLGRPIHSIAFEEFPEGAMAKVEASGRLVANMEITNRVRVEFEEPVLEKTGKRPTAVFLVGKRDGVYRIGLVVRKPDADDDD